MGDSSNGVGVVGLRTNSTSGDARALGQNSVAVGGGALASGAGSTAVGDGAQAVGVNTVALGANSVATRDNSVSVGSSGNERVITNVAPGTFGTDAVNLNQLNAVTQQVASLDSKINDVAKNAYAGVAAALAMDSAPYVPGRWTLYEGIGYYKGQAALGISFRKTSSTGRWSISGGVSCHVVAWLQKLGQLKFWAVMIN